jgi:hypothetical protein
MTMKMFLMAAALAAIATAAGAQSNDQTSDRGAAATAKESSVRPAMGMGSKTMSSCTNDQKKYCGATPDAVLKECLVKNWTRIADACQDALGKPFDGAAPHRE